MRKFLWFLLFALFSTSAVAQYDSVMVGILVDRQVSSILMQAKAGTYVVHVANSKFDLRPEDGLSIKRDGSGLLVKSLSKQFRTTKQVRLVPKEEVSRIRIRSSNVDVASRLYRSVLMFEPKGSQIACKAKVPLEEYVAGVVQSESGKGRAAEYYKLQSIICRTYALRNFERHAHEGFSMCDQTHCQVYKGGGEYSKIKAGAFATAGQVVVDANIEFIDATFHSNCGGETVASEDVWSKEVPYLRPVQDKYCRNGKHGEWVVEMSKEKWISYLSKKGVAVDEPKTRKKMLKYNPACRDIYLANVEPFISLEDVRADLGLKSTSFSIDEKGDKVLLKGKGFGHGVGMCQEGAMVMALTDKDFKEILNHYFSEVHIVDIEALDFFRDEELTDTGFLKSGE